MFQTICRKIYSFGLSVANIGITQGLAFHEKKKTQLLNVVVATGIPLNIFFVCLNLFEHNLTLAITNMLLFAGGCSILIMNHYQRFSLSRLILISMSSILFSYEAAFFRNGAEYYLIANLIVIIIFFNERKYILPICFLDCLLFIGIKIYQHSFPDLDGTISTPRIIFNISWALVIMVLALLFFKREQQSYQLQVEEKNKELEKLNEAKQKLFSIIAHDLRSPIGQLKSSLDLVNKEYMSPETFMQISAKLSSEVDQLHNTLDNLLRWSISQFQGIKVLSEKVALADIIEKMTPLFKQPAERKNIALQIEEVNFFILADPDHLMLVLRNLVSNAIKYSYKDGTIIIRGQTKNNRVIIEVADLGMGMSEETKAAVFSSVNMISSNGTSNEKGTGLGLKLCKEFIEKNSGQIWVESVEKKGTSFFVSLQQAN